MLIFRTKKRSSRIRVNVRWNKRKGEFSTKRIATDNVKIMYASSSLFYSNNNTDAFDDFKIK